MIRKRTLATEDKKVLIGISEEGLSTGESTPKSLPLSSWEHFCSLLQSSPSSTKCISLIEILLANSICEIIHIYLISEL